MSECDCSPASDFCTRPCLELEINFAGQLVEQLDASVGIFAAGGRAGFAFYARNVEDARMFTSSASFLSGVSGLWPRGGVARPDKAINAALAMLLGLPSPQLRSQIIVLLTAGPIIGSTDPIVAAANYAARIGATVVAVGIDELGSCLSTPTTNDCAYQVAETAAAAASGAAFNVPAFMNLPGIVEDVAVAMVGPCPSNVSLELQFVAAAAPWRAMVHSSASGTGEGPPLIDGAGRLRWDVGGLTLAPEHVSYSVSLCSCARLQDGLALLANVTVSGTGVEGADLSAAMAFVEPLPAETCAVPSILLTDRASLTGTATVAVSSCDEATGGGHAAFESAVAASIAAAFSDALNTTVPSSSCERISSTAAATSRRLSAAGSTTAASGSGDSASTGTSTASKDYQRVANFVVTYASDTTGLDPVATYKAASGVATFCKSENLKEAAKGILKGVVGGGIGDVSFHGLQVSVSPGKIMDGLLDTGVASFGYGAGNGASSTALTAGWVMLALSSAWCCAVAVFWLGSKHRRRRHKHEASRGRIAEISKMIRLEEQDRKVALAAVGYRGGATDELGIANDWEWDGSKDGPQTARCTPASAAAGESGSGGRSGSGGGQSFFSRNSLRKGSKGSRNASSLVGVVLESDSYEEPHGNGHGRRHSTGTAGGLGKRAGRADVTDVRRPSSVRSGSTVSALSALAGFMAGAGESGGRVASWGRQSFSRRSVPRAGGAEASNGEGSSASGGAASGGGKGGRSVEEIVAAVAVAAAAEKRKRAGVAAPAEAVVAEAAAAVTAAPPPQTPSSKKWGSVSLSFRSSASAASSAATGPKAAAAAAAQTSAADKTALETSWHLAKNGADRPVHITSWDGGILAPRDSWDAAADAEEGEDKCSESLCSDTSSQQERYAGEWMWEGGDGRR